MSACAILLRTDYYASAVCVTLTLTNVWYMGTIHVTHVKHVRRELSIITVMTKLVVM